jgi:uncharacterized protein with HEPN domain
MPPRDWRFRLEDILKAIEEIKQFTQDLTCDRFYADTRTMKAVLYSLAVIGEAARHIPEEVKADYPEIPWRDISDMRNVVIHEYFGVDPDILWETIHHDLPSLQALLISILKQNS